MDETLLDATHGFVTARTERAVHETAVRALADVTGTEHCAVVRFEEGEMVEEVRVNSDRPTVPPADHIAGPNGVVEQCFETDESTILDDLTDVRSASADGGSGTEGEFRSLLCVPTETSVLVAASATPSDFSRADGETVEQLASLHTDALDRVAASRTDRTRSDLIEKTAALLSHETKKPLSVAYAHLELAQATGEAEHFETALDGLDRLDGMLDDSVTLLRTGERTASTERVDPCRLARTAWQPIDTADVTLGCTVDAEIAADPRNLRQLFENLFRNAVEHGETTTLVRVGVLEDGSGLYVEDDGSGISAADRDSVFEYGYSSTDDQTGFGLNIVRWIAELHGWDVTLSESTGGGARFEFAGVDFLDGT